MLVIALAASPAQADEFVAPAPTESVWLQTNVRELYPRLTDMCLSTYEPMRDAPGVVLQLNNEMDRFSRYRYWIRRGDGPSGRRLESRSGSIPVHFDSRSSRPQHIEVLVQAISISGAASRPYSVTLGYYPGTEYAAAGQRSPGWMVVQKADLYLCDGSVGDWIVERPTMRDRAEARRRWGNLIAPFGSDVDKARAIARDLVHELRRHEGIPSDVMRKAPGLVQLTRAESGADHVWCGNYADIFSAACNALGIPVRKVDMQHTWPTSGTVPLEIGEAHRTNEVFDRRLNRWVWLDLTLGCMGAQVNEGEPLTARDIWRVLDDPKRRMRLRLLELDDASGRERWVTLPLFRHGEELTRFFSPDQRFQFVRLARASGS